MDWQLELVMGGKALLAAVMGGIVGLERARTGRDAGIRTYSAVSLGSCVFAMVSANISGADPSRLASNIVTGIGFLGAGVILRDRGRTRGLTSAATLWATAAIGTGIGFGLYPLSILTALIVLLILFAPRMPGWSRLTGRTGEQDDGE
ncbi:MAG: MgtC/SapB family protein [Planctomycetota bacterium]